MKKANSRTESTSYEFDSSTVNNVIYNHTTNTLTITFESGLSYKYDNVEERVFNDFVDAKSQGVYFNDNIKDNYNSEKL